MSADWQALGTFLRGSPDRVDLSWQELERIVGGMPASSIDHVAWWSGDRPHTRAWKSAGYTLELRDPGSRVVFVRSGPMGPRAERSRLQALAATPADPSPGRKRDSADLILVSCSKEKAGLPAPAKELYRSNLFIKMSTYALASGRPWFILSAEHGLVALDEWLAPYDRYLKETPAAYRTAWGEWVVARLDLLSGGLRGKAVEVHAGATYVDPLRKPLARVGAQLQLPLAGLSLGQRLAWYTGPGRSTVQAGAVRPDGLETAVESLVAGLCRGSAAVSPDELRGMDPRSLDLPGLYSWWIDEEGATDLSAGIGHPVAVGMIYAGLAGATRWPSGKQSTNTLWSRLVGMHLGKRASFSTFRLTLGSVLAVQRSWDEIDERRLTEWMEEHLRVVTTPWPDADRLKAIEHEVLKRLDPPLNLDGMERTDLRRRLTELRRGHS